MCATSRARETSTLEENKSLYRQNHAVSINDEKVMHGSNAEGSNAESEGR
jgi:hypothetical protein